MKPTSTSIFIISIAIGLGNAGLGYDVALIGGLLANPAWFKYFGIVPGSALLGTVIAVFIFAAIAVAVPAAILSDLVGRRRSIIVACFLGLGGAFGQTFASNLAAFIASRVLSGFAIGITLTNSAPYVNEVVCSPARAQSVAISQTPFYLGSISAAWCAFGAFHLANNWSWRLVLIVQALWPLTQLILILFCPESPRWLVMRGKLDEARKAMAATSTEDKIAEIEMSKSADDSWISFLRRRNWIRLFLIILLGLATQLTGNGIINYYLPPVLELIGVESPLQQLGLNAGVQMFAFVMASMATIFVDRLGRRKLLLASATGMLLSLTALTACSAYADESTPAILVIIFIFLFTASYNVGFTPVPGLYVAELVPTEMRAKASAMIAAFAGIGSCINQWVNPIALSAMGWKYFLIYIGTDLLTIVLIYVFAPETKGLELEEAAKVCDRA